MKIMRYLLVFTILSSGLVRGSADLELEKGFVAVGNVPNLLFSGIDQDGLETVTVQAKIDCHKSCSKKFFKKSCNEDYVIKAVEDAMMVKLTELKTTPDYAKSWPPGELKNGEETVKTYIEKFIQYFEQYRLATSPWRANWFVIKVNNLLGMPPENFILAKFLTKYSGSLEQLNDEQRKKYIETAKFIANRTYMHWQGKQEESHGFVKTAGNDE
jgi:hypothetical protein